MRTPLTRLRRRSAALVAAAGVGAAALLFVATPASANTNFNHSCEVTEACIFYGFNGTGWLWDYESTDTNLSNNWYPYSGAPTVDNNSASFWGRGGSCWAGFGPNYGGAGSQPWIIWQPPGSPEGVNAGPGAIDTVSSLFWDC